MWISNKIASLNNNKNIIQEGEITQFSTNMVYVENDEEHRSINVLAPYGIAYVPPQGEDAIVLKLDNKSICAGMVMPNKELEEGELMLFSSGGASIVLKNDGKVLINGKEIK